MLQFLQDLKMGKATHAQLSEIFNHPDYEYEFRRYGVTRKESVLDYFLNLNTIKESEIPFLRESRMTELKDKHSLWLFSYENPEHYGRILSEVKQFITDEMLSEVAVMVNRGLPDGINMGNVDVICTMSIGGSFGYVFDGAFHFDLLRLASDNLKVLPLLFAHEIHHVGMMKYQSEFKIRSHLKNGIFIPLLVKD